MLDGVLVGYIFCASLAASLFFLKFWRATHDQLFVAFAIVFAIEGITRLIGAFVTLPDDQIPYIYLARLFAYLILIASIVYKNRRRKQNGGA